MGNCHAVDPVSATVEHPNGKVEKLYFSSSARQLMLQHPGHYVALLPPPPTTTPSTADGSVVHVKRKLKLLPPDSMLNIGSCYKLVSFEDVLSELSDNGSMAHQTVRRRAHSNTTANSKHRHSPTKVSKEQSDVSKAAVKHINQLRAMLSKSFAPQKENVSQDLLPQLTPATRSFLSIQSPLESSLRPVQRGGAWRPNLQSIAERGR